MVSTFGVSADPANWGVVGWSMGGTCAVDLTVMHPDLFSAFEDIAGDIGPNSGNKDQTIEPGCSAATPPPTRHSTRPRSSPDTARTSGVAGLVRHLVDGAPVPLATCATADERGHRGRRTRRGRPTRAIRPRRPTRCARSAGANGIDCAVVPQHRASTTGRSRTAFSPLRCPGSPGSWALRVFRGRRCPPLPRPSPAPRWSSRPSTPTPPGNSACVVRRARSACGLRSALPSVERMDPMGEHAADPGPDLDAAMGACGVDCAVADRESLGFRQARASPRVVDARDAGRRAVDQPSAPRRGDGGQRGGVGGRTGSDIRRAPASAAASADRPRAADGLTLVYWQLMARYFERQSR